MSNLLADHSGQVIGNTVHWQWTGLLGFKSLAPYIHTVYRIANNFCGSSILRIGDLGMGEQYLTGGIGS